MRVVIPLLVFLLGSGAVVGLYALIRNLPEYLTRRRIEARMRDAGGERVEEQAADSVVKQVDEGAIPALDRFAAGTQYGSTLSRLIEQAGCRISVSTLCLFALASGLAAGTAAGLLLHRAIAFVLGALLGSLVPFLVLFRWRRSRLKKFEEQFPEVLDLLSRAIRAGHAFTTAMGMVAQEGPDPAGPEFKKTYDEQNFGLPMKDALNNLIVRVPLLDVRFFVTAILIQRETGGNLSEILENLAHVVRERFKVLRQVRVHTAHGRFTGYVLMALPAALAIVLSFINPEHMRLLFTEPMGRAMLMVAVVLQVIGYVWIKRVVKIEV